MISTTITTTTTMDWSPGEHLARVLHEEQAASDLVTNWLASSAYGNAVLWYEQ